MILPGIGGLVIGGAAGGAPYAEIGNLGTSTGAGQFDMGNNFHSGIEITVPAGGIWVKTAKLLLKQAALGSKVTPLIYSGTAASISTATLLKTGQEYVEPTGFSASTVTITINWNSDGSAYFLAAGTYILAEISSTGGQIISWAAGGTTYWIADTYVGGAATPWGSGSNSAVNMCLWTPYSVTGP